MKEPFDPKEIILKPLTERNHDIGLDVVKQLLDTEFGNSQIEEVAGGIIEARKSGSSVIIMIGGHVVRSGVQRYIIDLMERGYINCVAMNGSVMIHDFEFALIGATTESVSKYIKEGQFGLWEETGRINDYINHGYKEGLGMGESVGRAIFEGDFPYKDISIMAAGYRLHIPTTVHVGIGYDIIHEHPNCDGAATGATSYRDFLKFAAVVGNLEGGVVMNFGSAVMAPEVFLKALSMARNIALGKGRAIGNFISLVCDLRVLPDDLTHEPSKSNPEYYFRPWKTMLVRTVNDGGRSFYVQGTHADTIPALWTAIRKLEGQPSCQ